MSTEHFTYTQLPDLYRGVYVGDDLKIHDKKDEVEPKTIYSLMKDTKGNYLLDGKTVEARRVGRKRVARVPNWGGESKYWINASVRSQTEKLIESGLDINAVFIGGTKEINTLEEKTVFQPLKIKLPK